MSFNRMRYDNCATKLHVERSVGEGNYRLFPGYVESPDECLSFDGPRGSKADVSTSKTKVTLNWGSMAKIESDLLRLNVPLTDCNENATNLDYYKNETFNKLACSPYLNAEDTRFSYPLQAFRSMSTTSYQLQPWLFSNPQCHVLDNRTGLDSRITAKDSYKTPPPNFVDKGEALPKEKPNSPALGYHPNQEIISQQDCSAKI